MALKGPYPQLYATLQYLMIEEQNVKAKKLDFKEILSVSIDKVYEVGFVFFTIKIIWF